MSIVDKILYLLAAGIVSSGCQTYSIEITTSPPGADVYIYDEAKATYLLAGKTPFNINDDKKILTLISGSDFLALSIEMKGYVVERMLMDRAQAPKSAFTFNLKKTDDWGATGNINVGTQALEGLIRETQRIINLVKKNELDVAYAGALSLISRHPEVPIFWEMKGSIELLKDRKTDAKKSFEKSIALGSKNPETTAVLLKIGDKS